MSAFLEQIKNENTTVLNEIEELVKSSEVSDEARCSAFWEKVSYVNSLLTTGFTATDRVSSKSESLEEAAAQWENFEGIAFYAFDLLDRLDKEYPGCGGAEAYNNALDMLTEAKARREFLTVC